MISEIDNNFNIADQYRSESVVTASYVYKFPDAAKFGRVISKSKIYQHATPTAKVKELFVSQLEKIIWSYKLSPTTINLPAKGGVDEIQIFTLILKNSELKHEVLAAIDKAIPSPIIFILSFEDKIRYTAAYKRPSEADKNRWVTGDYFTSADYAEERSLEKKALPIVLDMKALYETLLTNLISLTPHDNETLLGLVERIEQIRKFEREAVKLDSRLKKTKQFNRKVELNTALRKLHDKIKWLRR